MIIKTLTPEDAIRKNKELNSFSPKEDYIKAFKKELKKLFDNIEIINDRKDDETEEHLKTDVREFLIHSVYPRDEYAINTKGKIDLAIYLGKDTNANVGVIIEAKRPKNKGEMITVKDVNKKALHEILLYSFKERETNPDLKYIIITNVEDWYLININDFENKHIFNNINLKKEFNKIKDEGKTNPHYYEQVKKIIPLIDYELPCVHFNLNDYKDIKDTPKDQKKLINLYKLLSPDFLLKKPLENKNNKLNTKFYNELLHIIGIEPVNEGGKIVIKRKAKPDTGSFLENTINILETEDVLRKVANTTIYGSTNEDKLYNIGLELVLTWINRVLFLKLLEGQLKSYNKDNPEEHKFLNPNKIKDFDELYKLFHQVLSKNYNDRSETIKKEYNLVPYLNSSLFEISELESLAIKINSLDDNLTIPVLNKTVIKTDNNKLNPLRYLLEFLNAYDFGSEKDETTASEKLINASVLGLIFEKINGYKDGSFYTPGFITQYMCKETIERAIIQKFNEVKGWDCKNLTDLHNKEIDTNLKESNAIIDSVKICDPAVGSGHFLVSALNQMIAIKNELNVLVEDRTADSWKKLRGVDIKIINDELSIQVDETNFLYNPKSPQSQTIQKALFEEKQIIIENCLFGVDINPNSVKICRLRLWIELLKNAYYKEITLASSEKIKVLETLPNIDINIKCGNSLIARFALDADIKEALKKSKLKIDDYKRAVDQYRNAESKEQKREMERLIEEIKTNFNSELRSNDPKLYKLKRLKEDILFLPTQTSLFEKTAKEKKEFEKKYKDIKEEFSKLETEIEEIKNNKIYENAFEWRFEFPEVLNDEGDFVGFDVVIGNPPYVYRNADFDGYKNYFKTNFFATSGNFDLYKFFIELSLKIQKPNSFHSFITNSSFLLQNSFSQTREFIISNSEIIQLIPLGPNVFDEATVDSVVYILRKVKSESNLIEIKTPEQPKEIFNSKSKSIEQSRFLKNDGFVFDYLLEGKEYDIIDRLFKNFPLIETKYDFGVGINTGYIKEELTSESKINEKYHPMVPGTGIPQKYGKVRTTGFIMYDKEFVKSKGKLGRTLPDEKFLSRPKILVVRTRNISMKQRIISTIDYDSCYNLNRLSNIISKENNSLEGLLGVLNSKLFNWIYSVRFLDYEIKPIYLRNSPLCDTNNKDLINKVQEILSLKKNNSTADTSALEREIDIMVYALYQLTFEEVLIIDPNFNNLITKEKYELYLKN